MSPEYRYKQLFDNSNDFDYDLSFNSDVFSLGTVFPVHENEFTNLFRFLHSQNAFR